MRDYDVDISKHEWTTRTVIANSPTEAADLVLKSHPPGCGWQVDAIDNRDVTGRCQGCRKVLFDGDDYGVTLDEVRLCGECAKVGVP